MAFGLAEGALLASTGGSILSALLGADAQSDYIDQQEQALEQNLELQMQRLAMDEEFNNFIRQLATASSTNVRGDRTFYDEETGYGIDASPHTQQVSALLDLLTRTQAQGAVDTQSRAIEGINRRQPQELGLADVLLSQLSGRDPLTSTEVRNDAALNTNRDVNSTYDRAIEAVLGRYGSSSNAGQIISDLNKQRTDAISDKRVGLPKSRSIASSVNAAESSNLMQVLQGLTSQPTVKAPPDPGTELLSILQGRANTAPQTLGITRNAIVPQVGVVSGPDTSTALGIGSAADAISGSLNQYQANQTQNQLLDILSRQVGTGGNYGNVFNAYRV